jgi:acyl-CoA synthetase (AMP-forming)/AMP-acid ligase II
VSFGSPALWRRVGTDLAARGMTLPALKRVVMAGAPIPPDLHALMLDKVLAPDADIYTPYGATECLPVTCFTGRQVLAETDKFTREGRGYCVGKALPRVDIRIIRYTDAVISRWDDVQVLPPGEIGEVVVRGPNVSRRYFDLPEQTALHKIYETEDTDRGPFWHRIDDLGYLDASGRLWFCGRKAHRVETGDATLYTVCCEAIFNEHPRVARTALVGVGEDRRRQTPVLIAEPIPGEFPGSPTKVSIFSHELREIAERHAMTRDIGIYLFHHAFPVDIRHNAKIFREKLARWAIVQPEFKAAK